MATLTVKFSRRKKTKEDMDEERFWSFTSNPRISKYKYWISGIGCNDFDDPIHLCAPGSFRWVKGENQSKFYLAVVVDDKNRLLSIDVEPYSDDELRTAGFLVHTSYPQVIKGKTQYFDPVKMFIVPMELYKEYDEDYLPINLIPNTSETREIQKYCRRDEKKGE